MSTATLATWNIGSLYTRIEFTLPYLEKVLTKEEPDLLCLQELPESPALWDSIADWGSYDYRMYQVISPSHVDRKHNMGIGVFSRYPLSLRHVLRLNTPTVSVSYQGKPETWHDKLFIAVAWGSFADSGECEEGGLLLTGHSFPFHRYGLENPSSRELIVNALAPLDVWMEKLTETTASGALMAAADFNLAEPMRYLHRCNGTWIDLTAGQATRPSGRKTDAILLPQTRLTALSSPPILRFVPSPHVDGTPLFDHFYLSAQCVFS